MKDLQALSSASLVAENRANNVPKAEVRRDLIYCLYARKSSEDDERQALSIDSQIHEMQELARREGLNVVEIRRESHSAKSSGEREEFNRLMADFDAGTFNAILTWAPDRLSRNGGDLGRLVDLMDRGRLHEIRTHSQRFTNSPNEKFLLMILGSQAKLENDNRGVNVKRGLKNKVEMGWRPGLPPLGYSNEKSINRGQNRIFIDEQRAPIIRKIFEMVGHQRMTGRAVHAYLKGIDFRTTTGKFVQLSSIYRILKCSFYNGTFEYPVGSGRFYKGAHEPLITKELFDRVQDQIATAPRAEFGEKDFQFIKMFKCACGSAMTADEKFKRNKTNGGVHRYVYYRCTRGKNPECLEPPIREKDITEQLAKLMDEIDIDMIGAKKKAREDLAQLQALAGVFGQRVRKVHIDDSRIREYAKHKLLNGSREEKRELLEHVRNSVVIAGRVIKIGQEKLST